VESYDAIVLVSFGGPERPDDVIPFLETVTRGQDIPRARLDEVAANYRRMGGRSPLNDANRALLAALRADLDRHGIDLPLYWGNRNWHPLLTDTVAQMADDGVERALAFVTSAFSSYSSCRRYLDDIEAATAAVPGAPSIDKLRVFFNHPGFLETEVELVAAALDSLPAPLRTEARLVFTAHSIPTAMAATCDYELQLRDTAAVVAAGVGRDRWDLAFQSRSGPPSLPWLGPDVNDHLAALAAEGVAAVVAVPIGFVSDNMEVVFDLDVRAAETADRVGLAWARAATVGTHSAFVAMIRELILERLEPERPRRWLGDLGLRPDPCHAVCCPAPGAHRGA
jgi:protoporphyrin/coproporphyrin ferrochelatase